MLRNRTRSGKGKLQVKHSWLLAFSFVAALILLPLCQPVSAASPKQKKSSPVWQNVEQVSIQPEGLRFNKSVYDGIPEDYVLIVADRAMVYRLLNVLRQHHRLAQGTNLEPPQLAISLQTNGFCRNWWTLQLVKKHGYYPLQLQHNSQGRNDLQLSYTNVSTSQLKSFLRLVQISSHRAHHKQNGYTFGLIGGV